GTNSTCYQVDITRNAQGQYVASAFLIGGNSPLAADSGEIFIKLDWSSLSSLGGPSTTTIANTAAAALLSTNLIPALGGRALAELPLHLAGHSRGSSVVAEMARFLGAQGLWVDQVTTLDPHPVGSFGDPAMKNYANILFADNYWQNLGDNFFVPNGQTISGAYNRQLTDLNGGNGSSHSDVHLWYHGTIDTMVPLTVDGSTINATQRQTWWTTNETAGATTGFYYSLAGGGDRLSNLEPAGVGNGRIRDGYNKIWDLGAGVAMNRDSLPANNGAWPNVLKLNISGTNRFSVDEAVALSFYTQFGATTSLTAEVRFFLDADANPYTANNVEILQTNIWATGTANVSVSSLNVPLNPTNTVPGTYNLFARIHDGVRTRYLYAPQKLILLPSRRAPILSAPRLENAQFRFTVSGFAGQTIVVQSSTNLWQWTSISTNTMGTSPVEILDATVSNLPQRFYRAVLFP
ncbi:MAG: hypothetical protein ABIR24_10515, partial [Verrucomicrobiota bacterium]